MIAAYKAGLQIAGVQRCVDFVARWTGRRDHAMFALTIQTGLRISELAGLDRGDLSLDTGAHVHTVGKGRKERRAPLVHPTRTVLEAWLDERDGAPTNPLLPTTTGKHMSRDAIERRLAQHLDLAAATCPSIADKRSGHGHGRTRWETQLVRWPHITPVSEPTTTSPG